MWDRWVRPVYSDVTMPESKRRKPKAIGPTKSKHVPAQAQEPSPTWYVAVMAGLMAVGTLIILVRFIFDTDQVLLLIGLGLITAGFIMTTNYR